MNKNSTRRSELRNRPVFPVGSFTALLTSALVTLIGVFLGLEPLVILTRAFVSAVVIGSLSSLGMSIVRMANSEQDKDGLSRP